MNTREALVEILQTSKGMNSEDAQAFVKAIVDYTRRVLPKSRIVENMTNAARGAFGINAEKVVELTTKLIDETQNVG
jgi:hypothetical protein